MSKSEPDLYVFGLALTFERPPPHEKPVARAVYMGPGLKATMTLTIEDAEIQDLLEQVERQYADFSQPVRWRQGEGELALQWDMSPIGHASGTVHMKAYDWTLDAPLRGDQTYLPKMALGLRLLLR